MCTAPGRGARGGGAPVPGGARGRLHGGGGAGRGARQRGRRRIHRRRHSRGHSRADSTIFADSSNICTVVTTACAQSNRAQTPPCSCAPLSHGGVPVHTPVLIYLTHVIVDPFTRSSSSTTRSDPLYFKKLRGESRETNFGGSITREGTETGRRGVGRFVQNSVQSHSTP